MKQVKIKNKRFTIYWIDDELLELSLELHYRMKYVAITLFKLVIEIDW